MIGNARELMYEITSLLLLDTDLRERGISAVTSRYTPLVAVMVDGKVYTVIVEELGEDD